MGHFGIASEGIGIPQVNSLPNSNRFTYTMAELTITKEIIDKIQPPVEDSILELMSILKNEFSDDWWLHLKPDYYFEMGDLALQHKYQPLYVVFVIFLNSENGSPEKRKWDFWRLQDRLQNIKKSITNNILYSAEKLANLKNVNDYTVLYAAWFPKQDIYEFWKLESRKEESDASKYAEKKSIQKYKTFNREIRIS